MSSSKPSLKLEDKQIHEDLLYAHMFHTGEGKIKWAALGVAIVIHLVVLVINFPEFKAKVKDKPKNVIVVKKYVPPPPKVERRQVVKKKFTRKVPVPDPTPDEPEPIREPEPEIEPEPLPPDVEFMIGTPEPPPQSGPLLAGVGGVTEPVLIQETKIKPEFPELARAARIEGKVILQAIINKDGTVGDVTVLQCNRPGLGFEDEAIKGVKQWRWKPALQGDKPVDVFFTVVVEFSLS